MITGGAGFIGSHVVRHFVRTYPDYKILNLDLLTYAGNLENVRDLETCSNYHFIKADIVDYARMEEVFREFQPSDIIHLAAESHVDRSIHDPSAFVKTNVLGTLNLLLCARNYWKDNLPSHRFHHVSTDEVYGSLGDTGYFTESTAYDPRSPYSASKASSDHMVRAFFHTYGLPVVISNCSNNYGSHQFPEKLIPLVIHNIIEGKELPVYGKGLNVRDWLWVGDHVGAIDLIFHKGTAGESYNVGGNCEMRNIDLVRMLCELTDEALGRTVGSSEQRIRFISDRPGHDLRYAIDAGKIKKELGWTPSKTLREGLKATLQWYLANKEWLASVTSGAYLSSYDNHYANRKQIS